MPRRKKQLGVVEVYDDDAPPRGRDGAGDFDDLGLSPRAGGAAVGEMTHAELEATALAEANEGRAGTRRALATALETREVGVATAATMRAQTEQLERLGENIEEVHDYLDKSDRIIDKMSRPKIARMFGGRKKAGKGLEKVRAGKKELGERDAEKAQGLGAVDLGKMGGEGGEEREELFMVGDVGKRGKKAGGGVSARAVQEDYAGYSDGVAGVMRAQDDDLDQISDALGDLKALADGMNHELNYQGRLIDEAQTFTEETSRRTKDQAKRINRIK